VCVECLIGKQKKPTSRGPYRVSSFATNPPPVRHVNPGRVSVGESISVIYRCKHARAHTHLHTHTYLSEWLWAIGCVGVGVGVGVGGCDCMSLSVIARVHTRVGPFLQ